ncbi:heavy metal sensor histidine kinase [Gallaecimonas kandeliae]|uniref:heavy metal sensor histidine kinase n=1 Tax=Gallaecimonas kandeliae TaxID=3029055 RepID=UPI0026477CA7|nr:heavy metal sensor histidine kinase [Gallaecimonas kandeliae]WKE65349.1 heavy metal sensor histidine kinase [Gallaecimonas kandeliae]
MKTSPASLARRVLLLVGLAIVLCLTLLGWLVQQAIEKHFADMDRMELKAAAQALEQAVARQPQGQPDLTRALRGLKGISFALYDDQGRLLYQSPGPGLTALLDDAVATMDDARLQRWQDGGHAYRGAALKLPGPYRLALAMNIDIHQRFLDHFRGSLWALMVLAALAILAAAWLAVRWGHAPLRQLSARIRSLSTDSLAERLDPTQVPAELQELVAAFNTMLAGMEEGFERLTNFSADIAHELRTPLTNLVTQTQVALGKARSQDEYREILYSNLEEFERLAKMVTDMLWLAQTDNGRLHPALQPLALKAELAELLDYFALLAEDKGVQLQLSGDDQQLKADRQLLRRALSNLLSNAIRHTPAGEKVQVRLATEGQWVQIQVENPGETIPAQHLPHLFDRFYRVDPARGRDGVGLGLAITQSIIQLHGGHLAVSSEAGLTRFTLSLPA